MTQQNPHEGPNAAPVNPDAPVKPNAPVKPHAPAKPATPAPAGAARKPAPPQPARPPRTELERFQDGEREIDTGGTDDNAGQ